MRYTGEKTLQKARKKFGYGNDDKLPTSSVNQVEHDLTENPLEEDLVENDCAEGDVSNDIMPIVMDGSGNDNLKDKRFGVKKVFQRNNVKLLIHRVPIKKNHEHRYKIMQGYLQVCKLMQQFIIIF